MISLLHEKYAYFCSVRLKQVRLKYREP